MLKQRLLIVDDDVELVDSLRDILEDAGYAVDVASTAANGYDILKRAPIKLVLLDYNLPDGKGLTWAIQYQEQAPSARIFLMTGMSERDLPPTSAVYGVIPKPVAPVELLRLIHAALQ